MNKDNFKQFLVLANKNTYAAGDGAKSIKEKDSSTTLVFEKGDYRFHDNYFGGEPFGGREVIFYKDKPVWMMVYYGKIIDKKFDVNKIYSFLQKSLMNCPEDRPFRGPEELIDGKFKYVNIIIGDIEYFSGVEKIHFDNDKVYEARYQGGMIDI